MLRFMACWCLVVLGISYGFTKYEQWTCSNLSEMTGQKTNYILWDKCYIQIKGRFIPYEEYLAQAIAQGLKGE